MKMQLKMSSYFPECGKKPYISRIQPTTLLLLLLPILLILGLEAQAQPFQGGWGAPQTVAEAKAAENCETVVNMMCPARAEVVLKQIEAAQTMIANGVEYSPIYNDETGFVPAAVSFVDENGIERLIQNNSALWNNPVTVDGITYADCSAFVNATRWAAGGLESCFWGNVDTNLSGANDDFVTFNDGENTYDIINNLQAGDEIITAYMDDPTQHTLLVVGMDDNGWPMVCDSSSAGNQYWRDMAGCGLKDPPSGPCCGPLPEGYVSNGQITAVIGMDPACYEGVDSFDCAPEEMIEVELPNPSCGMETCNPSVPGDCPPPGIWIPNGGLADVSLLDAPPLWHSLEYPCHDKRLNKPRELRCQIPWAPFPDPPWYQTNYAFSSRYGIRHQVIGSVPFGMPAVKNSCYGHKSTPSQQFRTDNLEFKFAANAFNFYYYIPKCYGVTRGEKAEIVALQEELKDATKQMKQSQYSTETTRAYEQRLNASAFFRLKARFTELLGSVSQFGPGCNNVLMAKNDITDDYAALGCAVEGSNEVPVPEIELSPAENRSRLIAMADAHIQKHREYPVFDETTLGTYKHMFKRYTLLREEELCLKVRVEPGACGADIVDTDPEDPDMSWARILEHRAPFYEREQIRNGGTVENPIPSYSGLNTCISPQSGTVIPVIDDTDGLCSTKEDRFESYKFCESCFPRWIRICDGEAPGPRSDAEIDSDAANNPAGSSPAGGNNFVPSAF